MLEEVLPGRKMNFVGIRRPYNKLVSTGLSNLVANNPHDYFRALNFLTYLRQ